MLKEGVGTEDDKGQFRQHFHLFVVTFLALKRQFSLSIDQLDTKLSALFGSTLFIA